MKRLLLLLSVVAVTAGMAGASVDQGMTRLNFMGSWLQTSGSGDDTEGIPGVETDAWMLAAAIEYFLTKSISVGALAEGIWTSSTVKVGGASNTADVSAYGVGGRAKYHFMTDNQWVPYIGGQLMWIHAEMGGDLDGDGDGMMWGPIAGLLYELNDHTDFFIELWYQWFEEDAADVFDDLFGVIVGTAFRFK